MKIMPQSAKNQGGKEFNFHKVASNTKLTLKSTIKTTQKASVSSRNSDINQKGSTKD